MYFRNSQIKDLVPTAPLFRTEDTVYFDVDSCTHSDPLFDPTTSTCTGCGVVFGKTLAPLSSSSGILGGAHHHAFASAVRKPRVNTAKNSPKTKKKKEVLHAKTSQRPIPKNTSPRKNAKRSPTKTKSKEEEERPNTKDVIWIEDSVFPIESIRNASTIRSSTAKGGNALGELTVKTLDFPPNGLSKIILTGGYIWNPNGSDTPPGHPCPRASSLSFNELVELNTKILGSFSKIIKANLSFFSTHRRRTHVDMFVLSLAAHILIVHSGSLCETLASEDLEECLDFNRISERVRPSHSGSPPRSLVSVLCARTGTGITSIPRLIEDALTLAKKSV
jgi:hypothetical protein